MADATNVLAELAERLRAYQRADDDLRAQVDPLLAGDGEELTEERATELLEPLEITRATLDAYHEAARALGAPAPQRAFPPQ